MINKLKKMWGWIKRKFKAIFGIAVVSASLAGGVAVDKQMNPYVDRGSNYELAIVSDIPQGERVEIAKDRAKFTMRGWSDEYAISIEPQIAGGSFTAQAKRPFLSKKMEYKKGDITAFIEKKTDTEFDIDFTLDKKPNTNVFTYKISGAEDFDFFYQPALTQVEIDEGASQPENVIGSYAVYSKSKANHRVGSTNYATGKIMHIYRPKAIDANGVEVWAILDYTNGVLSVTVPQSFLDIAVYPVRVDPTFGYTTIGGARKLLYAGVSSDTSTTAGTVFTLGAAGTVDSMTAYTDSAFGTQKIDTSYIVYRHDSGGADVHGLVAIGETLNLSTPIAESWKTINFASESLSADDYILAILGNGADATNNNWIWGDTVGGTLTYTTDTTGAGSYATRKAVDPWNQAVYAFAYKHSIYATYTASAVAVTPVQDIIWFNE